MNVIIGGKSETTPPLAGAIAAHRFVADMKPEHLKKLVEVAMFKQFERDEMIFKEGDPANRFYRFARAKSPWNPGTIPTRRR